MRVVYSPDGTWIHGVVSIWDVSEYMDESSTPTAEETEEME